MRIIPITNPPTPPEPIVTGYTITLNPTEFYDLAVMIADYQPFHGHTGNSVDNYTSDYNKVKCQVIDAWHNRFKV